MDAKGSINLEDVFEYCKNKDEHKKHLKGYMYEYDVCPYLLENWDYIIDELTKERKSGNNAE